MKWLRGFLLCSVERGHWERFMNLCRHHQISLWNIKIHKNHVRFQMFSGDYKTLSLFVGKTHVAPHILEKKGFPFVCERAVRNWTFTFGLFLFFVVLRVLSLFVWQIHYEGQREYTKETIRKEVTELGVYPGMLRSRLNCDSIERSLRESYENMSWVSAEEKGCVLNIKIKEGTAEEKKTEGEEAPFHLTAPCDGTVKEIVTREGTPIVSAGTEVKKGDLLISGVVEVVGDDGTPVKYNGVCAEGEICIVTEKPYEDSINIHHMEKNKTGKDITVYTVCLNGSSISIKNPLKWFDNSANYDIISNVCVDRGFLPLGSDLKITERNYICYEPVKAEYSREEAERILKARFESKKMEYEENGCTITDKSLKIKQERDAFRASGTFTMLVSKMDTKAVAEEELQIVGNGKEDEDGTGTENS